MSVQYRMTAKCDWVPADQLRQHPDNPNNGDIDEITNSIRKVGCYRPVYVSSASNHILAGHHLYQALCGLGEETIPVSWIDNLDEEGEMRILMGDNQIASLAMLDQAMAIQNLQILAETEDGLVGTGFTDDVLARMEEDQAGGVGFGEKGLLDSLDQEIECPNCGHTFTRTIEA